MRNWINLLWAEVAELYLGCHQQSANHHEGEHVEADVVIPLTLVQVASDENEDTDEDGDEIELVEADVEE